MRAPEKHRAGNHWKVWFSWKCLPISPTTPSTTTSEAPTPAAQIRMRAGGQNGSIWPARPTEVERMCCPAGEHFNTEGGKQLPTRSFSHRPEAPPVTYTWREGGGRGSSGRVRRMRRSGMKAAEGWKRYWMVGGKKGGRRKRVARKKKQD